MSNTDQTICRNNISGNISRRSKPRYVRKLNFNRSVLEIDRVIKNDEHKSSSNTIEFNFMNAPCMDKEEFVREWIITHYHNQSDRSDDSNLSSPILGTTTIKRLQKSPVLGNQRKRSKQRNISVDASVEKIVGTADISSNVECQRVTAKRNELIDFPSPSSRAKQNNVHRIQKEKMEEGLFEYQTHVQSSPARSQSSVTVASPILNRSSHLFKSKCKQRNRIQKLQKCEANANSALSVDVVCLKYSNTVDNKDQILPTQRLECNDQTNRLDDRFNGSAKKPEMHSVLSSPIVDTECIECELSDTSNNTCTSNKHSLVSSVMECAELKLSDASNSTCNNNKHKSERSSDSDRTRSDIIEDPETQDVIIDMNLQSTVSQEILATSSENTHKQSVGNIENIKRNSCSKLDQITPTDVTTSVTEKISQILSYNESANNESNQTEITISTETTPPKSNMDPKVWVTLLNSGKKRKKPKKGSLVGRLQMLINSQISFVRIWRHQMSQMPLNKSCARFVVLNIVKFWTQYDRQLFEGVVIQDSFNLLGSFVQSESTKSCDSELSIKRDSNKVITIMTNPEIVGTINVKQENILKIYPPWDIIDQSKTILCILYFDIVDILEDLSNVKKRKARTTMNEMVIQEFDCPCLKEERVVESCHVKFSNQRPSVIREIFNS